ncbi:MAG: hypothetical protein PHU25_13680 [Deltaproteobacteria bacterium]|nr:hypothetical protein [Deltaproteobacteria bacterium]
MLMSGARRLDRILGAADGRLRFQADMSYALFALVLFADVIFGGARFVIRDLLHHTLPAAKLLGLALHGDASLLWDAGLANGMPFLARLTPAAGYPPGWIAAVLPADTAIAALAIAHLLAAAMATMRLALRHTSRLPAAWLGGLGFAFGGYLLSLIGGGPYLYGATLLAPSALGLYRLAERPVPARACQLAAVLALQALAADPQTLLYEALLIGLPVLLGRPAAGQRLRALSLAFAAAALAVLATSFQTWPAMELLGLSNRSGGVGAAEAAIWSVHPARLVEFVVPEVFGTTSPENTFWARSLIAGPHNVPWAAAFHVGLVPLLALPFLRVRAGGRQLAALGAVAAVSLLLAVGPATPLHEVLRSVLPLADRFRYPEKFLLFFCLAASLVGAAAVDGLLSALHDPQDGRPRRRSLVAIGIAGGFVAASASLRLWFDPGDPGRVAWLARVAHEQGASVNPDVALAATAYALVRAGAVGLGMLLVLVAAVSRLVRPTLLVALVTALGVTDLFSAGLPLRGVAAASWLRRPPAACAAMPRGISGRLPVVYRDPDLRYLDPPAAAGRGTRFERQRAWEWDTLKPNVGASECVAHVPGYEAVSLTSMDRLRRALAAQPGRELAMRGVEHVIARAGDPRWRDFPLEAGLPGLGIEIRAVPAHLPFLHAVGQVEAEADPARAAVRATEPSFPLFDRAVVETDRPALPGVLASREAHLTSYRPGRIEAALDFEAAGYLVVLESHYPGWRARLDDRDAQIFRTDGAFLGLAVPAGRHRLDLEFDPPLQRAANRASAAGLALLALLWIGACMSDHRGRSFSRREPTRKSCS